MRTRIALISLCVSAAAFLFGCTQVPQQTMDNAKKSLAAAKKAGAESYAPSQLKAAQDSYGNAVKEITEENRKLPFMRKYHKVIETLLSATSAAQSAETAAEAAKTRIRLETGTIIAQVRATSDSVEALLKEAAKKKKDTIAIAQNLDSARLTFKDASAALDAGDLLLAKEKATSAQERLAFVVKSTDGLVPPKKALKKKK
jgi:Domain of unknown function (DUF4398)